MKRVFPWSAIRIRTALRLCPFLAVLALCNAGNARAEVRVTDDFGREVALAKPARRIVALYAGFDEMLAAMDLTGLIAARTRDEDDPALAGLPVIGTHLRPNLELIAVLAPDLVLQMGGREDAGEATAAIERLGIPVATFRMTTFEEMFAALSRIGALAGEPDRAASLAAKLRARLAEVKNEVKNPEGGERPRVYFEVREQSPIGAGQGSFASDVIRLAGGVNALESKEKFVRLGEETILAADPDVVLVQLGPMNPSPSDPRQRPRLASLRAVKSGRVYFVDEKTFSRPGPRGVEAVARLAGILGENK